MKTADLKKGIIHSGLLHVGLILLILGKIPGCNGSADGGKSKDTGKVDPRLIVEKNTEKPTEVEIKEMPVDNGPKKPKKTKKKNKAIDKDCSGYEWFGGVGVEVLYDTQQNVTIANKVFQEYPAHKAGMMPGDIIVNFNDLRGPVGERIIVAAYRDGQFMEFDIIREKICVNPSKK